MNIHTVHPGTYVKLLTQFLNINICECILLAPLTHISTEFVNVTIVQTILLDSVRLTQTHPNSHFTRSFQRVHLCNITDKYYHKE